MVIFAGRCRPNVAMIGVMIVGGHFDLSGLCHRHTTRRAKHGPQPDSEQHGKQQKRAAGERHGGSGGDSHGAESHQEALRPNECGDLSNRITELLH